MMKPRYFALLLIVSFFIIASSCGKSFLDVPTNNRLTLQEHVVDLQKTGEFLNGIYILLARDFSNGLNQAYPEIVADNMKPESPTGFFLPTPYKWTQEVTITSSTMSEYWKNAYKIIRACSLVINKSEEYKDQDSVKAKDLMGQAYAIRAFIHFMLVNIYAQTYKYTADASHPGVPYVTSYDWNEPIAGRNSVADVYNHLIEDLKDGIKCLPASTSSLIVMNRLAAQALLARVYLFKEDFTNAKNVAREVGILKPIMIANYPAKLFTPDETEALFQLSPSGKISLPSPTGAYTGTYDTQFQGSFFRSPQLYCLATSDISNLIKQYATDSRKAWIRSGPTKDTITKFPTNVITGFSSSKQAGSYFPTLVRSSEMYLTAAECYARLNNDDSSRYYLNQLRVRAGIPEIEVSVIGASLLDSVYIERRKELAFEGLRMFDLQRWKKGVHRQDSWFETAKDLPFPSNKAVAPIPYLDATVTGLKQNPGY